MVGPCQRDQMSKSKVAKKFKKLVQIVETALFYRKIVLIKISHLIFTPFVRKLVAKNFQESPSLVTLARIQKTPETSILSFSFLVTGI